MGSISIDSLPKFSPSVLSFAVLVVVGDCHLCGRSFVFLPYHLQTDSHCLCPVTVTANKTLVRWLCHIASPPELSYLASLHCFVNELKRSLLGRLVGVLNTLNI